MVSICGMLELTGLLLTIATIRGHQCRTNKNWSSATPTLLPPHPHNSMTVPDIPHCSKRPVCIFHTWTILLSLKRTQKLFCSRNLNEIKTVCWITFCTEFCVSQRKLHQTFKSTFFQATLIMQKHSAFLMNCWV